MRWASLLGLLLLPSVACAQGIPNSATVVTTCGSVSPSSPYTAGQIRSSTQDTNGQACSNTQFTGVISGTVTALPSIAPTTDHSSMVTTGGTFQTVASANPARQSLEIVNLCNVAGKCTNVTDFCYVSFAASPSTSNAVPLQPGWAYSRTAGVIPSDAIAVTCDNTGDHFRATVQ
jgi:hypothetical protein